MDENKFWAIVWVWPVALILGITACITAYNIATIATTRQQLTLLERAADPIAAGCAANITHDNVCVIAAVRK